MPIYSKELRAEFLEVCAAFTPRGIAKGSELLLPPDSAVDLASEVARLGIVILGVDTWHYVDRNDHSKGIVEEVEYDQAVPEEVLGGPDAVLRSATIVRNYILRNLPSSTQFVSLVVRVPVEWIRAWRKSERWSEPEREG